MELGQFQSGICDGYHTGKCCADIPSSYWRCLLQSVQKHVQNDRGIDKL